MDKKQTLDTRNFTSIGHKINQICMVVLQRQSLIQYLCITYMLNKYVWGTLKSQTPPYFFTRFLSLNFLTAASKNWHDAICQRDNASLWFVGTRKNSTVQSWLYSGNTYLQSNWKAASGSSSSLTQRAKAVTSDVSLCLNVLQVFTVNFACCQ